MSQRAGILGKLRGAQPGYIAQALHRRTALVGGELLVAEDGQPLFQGELEPVAAGNAITCPVVEIFVGDHRLDVLVVDVRRGVRLGQDVAQWC